MNEDQRTHPIKILLGWLGLGLGGYSGYMTQKGLPAIVGGVIIGGMLVTLAATLIAPTVPIAAFGPSPKERLAFGIRSVFILDVLYLVRTFVFNEAIKANESLDNVLLGLAWVMGALTLLAFARMGQLRSGRSE